MGELLTFRKRADSVRRVVEIGPGGAEILFFLGVRYEPYVEPAAAEQDKMISRKRGAGKAPGNGKRRA